MRKYIAYDLHGQNASEYQDLYDYIEKMYKSFRVLESMYVIFSSKENAQIRDEITRLIGKRNASIIVGDMPAPVATNNVPFTKNWFNR